MRAPLLILAASLALAGCKNHETNDNSSNVNENLTAQNIVSNDVTAIDAVTGDAANMAADVDVNYSNLEENGAGEPATQATKPKTTPTRRPQAANPSAPSQPATQAATNSD